MHIFHIYASKSAMTIEKIWRRHRVQARDSFLESAIQSTKPKYSRRA